VITMKRWLTATAVCLSCLGMLLPQTVLAADAPQPDGPLPSAVSPPMPAVNDVALQAGGALVGQVVDQQGVPLAHTPVLVRQNDQEVASTITDDNGRFEVSGLRGGLYQVVAGQGVGIYRLWAANTAPPTAQASAMVVSGNDVVRGQDGGLLYWLTNPWVLAGIIAAAIAIPIAVSNHNRSSS